MPISPIRITHDGRKGPKAGRDPSGRSDPDGIDGPEYVHENEHEGV